MNRLSSSSFNTAPTPPSAEALKLKLSRIISCHQELKASFHQLNSQIATGLLEAEDVFVSLSVPLMKLVGLKTVEMAVEGRFNAIINANDLSYTQDENYMSKAMIAGNEMKHKQKLQLIQLINLLRKIEDQVNSSQNNIFQSLADHQASLKSFFLRAFKYVSSIHQSSQSNDLSVVMLKLLKATFDIIAAALGSVEVGVDDLIHELAENLCNPMAEYVNVLKIEMKKGACSHLLDVVKDMDAAMRARKFELAEARKRIILAEQSRVEALSMLRELKETAQRMTPCLGLQMKAKEEPVTQQEEYKTTDDDLIRELLRKKRKCQVNSTSLIPSPRSKGLGRQTSVINHKMIIDSSPSSATRKVLSRKRVTPRHQKQFF